MNGAIIELIAANITFVGSHFVMSHPFRPAMSKALGPIGFPIVYSLVSTAAIGWIYFAFKAAPPSDLPGSGEIGWVLATILMIPSLVLLAGSYVGNPALPMPNASEQARADPKGVFNITRHPMMWAFAIWALSHMVLFWSLRTMITAGAMAFLALVGAKLQDRKKAAQMGEAWELWQSRTYYWPRLGGFAKAGALPWAVGTILFVILSWLHMPLGGIPAGIWRWF